jgi:hypothetical protein
LELEAFLLPGAFITSAPRWMLSPTPAPAGMAATGTKGMTPGSTAGSGGGTPEGGAAATAGAATNREPMTGTLPTHADAKRWHGASVDKAATIDIWGGQHPVPCRFDRRPLAGGEKLDGDTHWGKWMPPKRRWIGGNRHAACSNIRIRPLPSVRGMYAYASGNRAPGPPNSGPGRTAGFRGSAACIAFGVQSV